jgi:hypothetical protein
MPNPLKIDKDKPKENIIETKIVDLATNIVNNSVAEQERLKDPTYQKVHEYATTTAKTVGMIAVVLMTLSPIFGSLWNLFGVSISRTTLVSMFGSMITNLVFNLVGGLMNRKAAKEAIFMVTRQTFDKTVSDKTIEINDLKHEIEDLKKQVLSGEERKELEQFRFEKRINEELSKRTQATSVTLTDRESNEAI